VHYGISRASRKNREKCEYTPGLDDGLIVIVTRCAVDGIVVGGIRLLLHMRGAQQRTPLSHHFLALSLQFGNYSGVIQLVQRRIGI